MAATDSRGIARCRPCRVPGPRRGRELLPGRSAGFGCHGHRAVLDYDDRQIRVGAFPISVDTPALIKRASDRAVQSRARQIRKELGDPDVVMLGVDRLDYTKGIDRRLLAMGELLADGSLSPSGAVLVQVGVPSREDDPHYRREREHLEQLVGEVNGAYSTVGRPPIHYLYQSVELDELVALYLAADVMLVTPLRDGMNLVAKEFVSCRIDAGGALVLSEFAGAAEELRDAILVNPHDLDGVKQAIRHTVDLDPTERTARMRRMRRVVRRHDVHAWARNFLGALNGTHGHRPPRPTPARGFESNRHQQASAGQSDAVGQSVAEEVGSRFVVAHLP